MNNVLDIFHEQCFGYISTTFNIQFIMFVFATALIQALNNAIAKRRSNTALSSDIVYNKVKNIYTWQNVAKRTEKVGDLTDEC